MSRRCYREAKKLIENEGLETLGHDYTGNSHLRIRCRRADGRERAFIFGVSPSEVRGIRNARSTIRRWAREAS